MSLLPTAPAPLANRPALRVVGLPAPIQGPHSFPFCIDHVSFAIHGPTTAEPPQGTALTIAATDHATTGKVYYLVNA